MRAKLWFALTACVTALSSQADEIPTEDAESAWTSMVQRNGVVVSQRDGSGTNPPEIRATTWIDATPLEILAVLEDDRRRVEWMARCAESRLLERQDRWNSIHYTRLAVWPFQDRDVVVETKIELSPTADTAHVRMQSVETPLQSPIRDVVRMPKLTGGFVLTANGSGTEIAYHLTMEFGGKVPKRIEGFARQFIPLETLENLREHVPAQRDAYADRVASWRRELSL